MIWRTCALVLLVSSGPVFAQVDGPSCYDAVDRVLRAAKDAESAASDVNDSRFDRSELDEVHSALDDVESRLRRAKSECEYAAPVARLCGIYRSIAMANGRNAALNQCKQSNYSRQSPDFCDACLGR